MKILYSLTAVFFVFVVCTVHAQEEVILLNSGMKYGVQHGTTATLQGGSPPTGWRTNDPGNQEPAIKVRSFSETDVELFINYSFKINYSNQTE